MKKETTLLGVRLTELSGLDILLDHLSQSILMLLLLLLLLLSWLLLVVVVFFFFFIIIFFTSFLGHTKVMMTVVGWW